MPYTQAIVLETLRMFMGRTFSIPHRALKDSTLRGYIIPKDTILIANFHSALMNEKTWQEPSKYDPERFLNNGAIHTPEFYIPFGAGKHQCMGQTLAHSNLFLFTSFLLQQFEFHIPPGQEPLSTKGIDGVTPGTGPFSALVKPRSFTSVQSL